MKKKKQNIIDLGLLRNFFHIRINIWIVVSSTVIFGSIYLYFLSLHNLSIFPGNNDLKFEFYTDSANGGNSKIIQHYISDTAIDLDFDLKKGFSSPYVGINITQKKNGVINLAPYNQFHLIIEGQRINAIGFCLFTRNPYNKSSTSSKELFFYTNLEISPERKQYDVDLSQLKVPDWWYVINDLSPNKKIKPDLKHIIHFTIGTAYSPILGVKHSLRIYSISFERNNVKLIRFLITSEFIVILLLIVIHYLRAYSGKKEEPLIIAYKPIDIDNDNRQIQSYLDFINNNFHDHNLTLEQVTIHTGTNQRRIANSIQQTFGCNFKTYVNRIRINESKRLLNESKLNMGEIAFKVGFSNQSHFNRVFKSLVGISPSEFREIKK